MTRDGFVRFSRWRCAQSTLSVATSIGNVLDISKLMPRLPEGVVQVLQPRRKSESSTKTYSGTFGLGQFPLHTDLAHWLVPPRYLMLRCQEPGVETYTTLMPARELESALGADVIENALVCPRSAVADGTRCLLSVSFSVDFTRGIRWDPVFLVPMNDHVTKISTALSSFEWSNPRSTAISLSEIGDTLILDNWRVLHGRSRVPIGDMGRAIDRVYFSEIFHESSHIR